MSDTLRIDAARAAELARLEREAARGATAPAERASAAGDVLAAVEAAFREPPAHEDPPKCPHGDAACPCQDGDACHYEGSNSMRCPTVGCAACAKGTDAR